MKLLFIGGSGNISSSCVNLALERGHTVSILSRGNREAPHPEVEMIRGNVAEVESVRAALAGRTWDVVANFIAFQPGDIDRDFDLFSGRTGQYIFISSASVYQKPLVHPFITESTPLANPYWQYSRDKIACEERCNQLCRESGFPVTIIRPAHTYAQVIPASIGSWEDYTLIDRMKRGQQVIIHGDGSSLWTVTHADDFARGFVGLCGHQQAIGHAFHITSDEVLTWNQIYQTMAECAGVELRAVHIASDLLVRFDPDLLGTLTGDKAVSKIFDNAKIKRFVPDFRATIPFREGFRRTLDWFEAKPGRIRILEENNHLMDRILRSYESAFPVTG